MTGTYYDAWQKCLWEKNSVDSLRKKSYKDLIFQIILFCNIYIVLFADELSALSSEFEIKCLSEYKSEFELNNKNNKDQPIFWQSVEYVTIFFSFLPLGCRSSWIAKLEFGLKYLWEYKKELGLDNEL